MDQEDRRTFARDRVVRPYCLGHCRPQGDRGYPKRSLAGEFHVRRAHGPSLFLGGFDLEHWLEIRWRQQRGALVGVYVLAVDDVELATCHLHLEFALEDADRLIDA